MNFKKWFRGLFMTIGPEEKKRNQNIPSRRYYDADSLAMKISAAFSAVKLISEGIAILPLELQRWNVVKKCFVPFYDDPLYLALSVAPNKRLSSFDFWREAVRHVLLRGNAYILPKKNIYGDIEELILCAPGSVQHDVQNDIYVVNDIINRVSGEYTADKIVHLRNIGLDGGYSGLSTISLAAMTLGISAMADEYTAKTLQNGGLIRGFISGDASGVNTWGVANEKQAGDVSARVETELNEGRQIISLPADVKFSPIALSPGDAKILDNKQMTIHELARFFRVHPELLYAGTNNTYKSSEVPNVMFLHQTLAPMLKQIETELLIKLVPRQLWGKIRIRFDREPMYLTDLTTEVAYMRGTLETGVYTVNDWRAKKGLPAVDDGDEVLISANLKTLKTLNNEGQVQAPAINNA